MSFATKNYVIKRDGRKEPTMFDKITSRISKLCYGLDMNYVDPAAITMKVVSDIVDDGSPFLTLFFFRSSPASSRASPPCSWTSWPPRPPPR